MRRPNFVIALMSLVVGLLVGSQLRPAPSAADDSATPQGYVVSGFESVELADLPISPERPDAGGTSIELRRSDGSTSPAWVSLTRYTYQPGGYVDLPYPYPGPVAYYVESGTLTLEAIGPNVTIVEVQRAETPDDAERMTVRGPGALTGRHEVTADNYVYAMDGELGPTRNDGDTPLVVLAMFLQSMEGGESAEEVMTAVPGTPSA